MDEDAELAAIRARLRQEMMQGASPTAATAPTAPDHPGPDHPLEVDDAGFEAFVTSNPFVVVDCWAPWCGPCRIVGPIVDQLAREMQGRVVFGKLNVDHNPAVSRAFAVQSIPTLLVFSEGRLVDRLVGAMPKPMLAQRIERLLGGRRVGGTPGPRRPER